MTLILSNLRIIVLINYGASVKHFFSYIVTILCNNQLSVSNFCFKQNIISHISL